MYLYCDACHQEPFQFQRIMVIPVIMCGLGNTLIRIPAILSAKIRNKRVSQTYPKGFHSQICYNNLMFYIAEIFVSYCYTTDSWLFWLMSWYKLFGLLTSMGNINVNYKVNWFRICERNQLVTGANVYSCTISMDIVICWITHEQALRNWMSVADSRNSGAILWKQSWICSWQCSTLAGRAITSESKCFPFTENAISKYRHYVSTDRRTDKRMDKQSERIHVL